METLLILHGWGSCSKNWQEVKEKLEEKGYQVYVPDLPGFGESVPPKTPWSVVDYVNWLNQYCQRQNISHFFLIGNSFGGQIATKYAIEFPAKIKKLCLVSPAVIRRKTLKKEILKKVAKFFKKIPFLRKIFYQFFIKSDYPATQGVMRQTYLKVIREDLSPLLKKISVPTLIIWGEKDKITPLADAYFIKREIKNSQLEIIPNVGHAIHKEAREILVEKISQFLK
mgnify:CR=1 FL=1